MLGMSVALYAPVTVAEPAVFVRKEVKLYPMSAPELMAELKAAPANGADVTSAPVAVAATDMAEDISLTMDDAVATESIVLFVMLTSSLTAGSRYLPRRFNSPGAYDVRLADTWLSSVVLHCACHEPILALVAATHFPETGTEPTKLEHP